MKPGETKLSYKIALAAGLCRALACARDTMLVPEKMFGVDCDGTEPGLEILEHVLSGMIAEAERLEQLPKVQTPQ